MGEGDLAGRFSCMGRLGFPRGLISFGGAWTFIGTHGARSYSLVLFERLLGKFQEIINEKFRVALC